MGELLRVGRVQDPRNLHHPVQNLPVVHPDDVIPPRDPHCLERIGQHRADLGIRGHACRSHRIRIALIELPEPPRPGLFVPPDGAHGIAPVGRRQIVPVLRIDPRQGRRQIVAQRQPVAVPVLLPGKDALVRAVHIRKELAQRLDRLHGRGFQGVEPVAMIHLGDPAQHLLPFGDIRPEVIAKALGRFRLGPRCLLGLGHGS